MLYFAYGSNMNRQQLVSRCPSAQFRFRGRVLSYRLGYTRFSTRRRCGVLDLVPCDAGEVWGGVFSIEEANCQRLDEYEFCAAGGYRRLAVEVQVDGNSRTTLSAIAYEVGKKLAEEIAPSEDYLSTVITGARQCGLPENYIQAITDYACSIPQASPALIEDSR